MADSEEEKSIDLSPPALAYLSRMLDDTVFIKRQQWAVTNYVALIYAGIIWFAQNFQRPPQVLTCALSTFAIIAGLTGTYLLIHFQLDLSELRGRIEKAVNYSFGPKEKQAFTIRERDPDRFSRGGHILFALTLVCIGGAALSVAAVWVKAS